MASNKFINECKNRANRNRLGKIIVDDKEITNSDNLQNYSIDSGCYVDGNIIGSVYSKCLKAQFISVPKDIELLDKTIDAKIGVKYVDNTTEYINMGKYTVERPKDEVTADMTSITAYDILYTNLDIPYVCGIDYTQGNVTLKDLYIDVCNQLKLIPVTSTFLNSAIPIANNPFTNGEKNRTVLQTIAKIASSFVDIDNDTNKIDLCWLSDSEEPDYIFYKNDYVSVEGGKIVCGPINCLIIKNSQVDDENVTIKDEESIALYGEHSIVISEDYILYNAELRQQAISAIWNRVHGMSYVDCKLTSYYGKPFLKLGDKIRVYTSDADYFDTYVLKSNFTYDGSFTSVIESPALTEQEIKTKQDISLSKKLYDTQVEVNKQKHEITAMVKEVSEHDSKITKVEQDVNTINQTINQKYDLVRETSGTTLHLEDSLEYRPLQLEIEGYTKFQDYIYVSDTTVVSNNTVIKGLNEYLDSVEGTSLIINNAKNKALKLLKVKGKSYQEVNEATRNICPSQFEYWESGDYSFTNGNKYDIDTRIRLKELLKVNSGETYYVDTFSIIGNTFSFLLRAFDENKNFTRSIGTVNNRLTFKISESEKFVGVSMYRITDGGTITYDDYKKWFEDKQIQPYICLDSETDKNFIEFIPNSPSPEFPSKIKNIGRIKNIFDGVLELGNIGASGENTEVNYRLRSTNYTSVLSNTNYVISNDMYDGVLVVCFYKSDKTFLKREVYTLTNKSCTFTTPADCTFLRFCNDGTLANPKVDMNVKYNIIKENDKNQIKLKVQNKNLFDLNTVKKKTYLNKDGLEMTDLSWCLSDYIKIYNNFYYDGLTNVGYAPYSCFYDKDYNFISSFKQKIGLNNQQVPADAVYVRFSIMDRESESVFDKETFIVSNIAIDSYIEHEEQNIAIDLKNNELCSLSNDVYDELVIRDNQAYINKKIGKVVLDGSENWISTGEIDKNIYIALNVIDGKGDYVDALCDYFTNVNKYPSELNTFAVRGEGKNLAFNSSVQSLNEFKSWLSTHNVTVYYELKNEEIIELEKTTINTYEDYTLIALEEELETNLYARYYKDISLKIVARQNDNKRIFKINLEQPLRSYLDSHDLLEIDSLGNTSIMRNVEVDDFGAIKKRETSVKEDLGIYEITLFQGINDIYIQDSTISNIYCQYLVNLEINKYYATRIEMNSAINQKADEISLEVSKKVDEDEFGTKITQNAEAIQFAWNQISQYFKFLTDSLGNANMNIYDNNNQVLMSLNRDGQDYYYQGQKVGHMGTNKMETIDDEGNITHYNTLTTNMDNGTAIEWNVKSSENPDGSISYNRVLRYADDKFSINTNQVDIGFAEGETNINSNLNVYGTLNCPTIPKTSPDGRITSIRFLADGDALKIGFMTPAGTELLVKVTG